jgi:hypothetical protein
MFQVAGYAAPLSMLSSYPSNSCTKVTSAWVCLLDPCDRIASDTIEAFTRVETLQYEALVEMNVSCNEPGTYLSVSPVLHKSLHLAPFVVSILQSNTKVATSTRSDSEIQQATRTCRHEHAYQ